MEAFMNMLKKGIIVTLLLLAGFTCIWAQGANETAAPAVQKEITLRWASIWVGNDSKAPAVEEIIKNFNAENAGKIQVIVEPQPDYNAYEQKVRTSLAAGTAPADIFTIKLNPTTSQFYQSDLLLDFNKMMDDSWKATFDAGSLAQSLRNGMLKSLPMETAILPIWFNMDAFKSVGVTEVPKTWDALYAAFDKLKKAGIAPTSQMTGDTNAWTSMIWFSHFAVLYGGTDVWSKPFTDTAFVKAAEKTADLIKNYSTNDAIGLGAGGSGGHFLAGRTAVFSNGPWYAGRADLAKTPFFNSIKIAALPDEDFVISRLQANICAASSKDKAKQDAEITFLKYLTKAENIEKIAKTSGSFFAVKTNYVPEANLPKQFAELVKNAKTTAYDLEAALGAEVTLEFTQQLSALASGDIDAKQFCALVDKKIKR